MLLNQGVHHVSASQGGDASAAAHTIPNTSHLLLLKMSILMGRRGAKRGLPPGNLLPPAWPDMKSGFTGAYILVPRGSTYLRQWLFVAL